MKSKVHSAMGGKHKRIKGMHVRPGAKKGYIVTHDLHHDSQEMPEPPEEHPISNEQELMSHIQEHLPMMAQGQAPAQGAEEQEA